MPKNLAGKTRKPAQGQPPYEVWTGGGWTFFVLKKNQANDDKPYATWNVGCDTPAQRGELDVGRDTYVADVKGSMRLVWIDPAYAQARIDQGETDVVPANVDTSPDGWKRYYQ